MSLATLPLIGFISQGVVAAGEPPAGGPLAGSLAALQVEVERLARDYSDHPSDEELRILGDSLQTLLENHHVQLLETPEGKAALIGYLRQYLAIGDEYIRALDRTIWRVAKSGLADGVPDLMRAKEDAERTLGSARSLLERLEREGGSTPLVASAPVRTIHDEGKRDPAEPRRIYEERIRAAWQQVSTEIRRTRRPAEIAGAAAIANHGIRLESSLFSGENGSFLKVTTEYSGATGKFVRAEVMFREPSGLGSSFYIWGGPPNLHDEDRVARFFLALWDREHPPLHQPKPPSFRRSLWRGIAATLTDGRVEFAWDIFVREQAVFVQRMREQIASAQSAPVPVLTNISPSTPSGGTDPTGGGSTNRSPSSRSGGAMASRVSYRSSAPRTVPARIGDDSVLPGVSGAIFVFSSVGQPWGPVLSGPSDTRGTGYLLEGVEGAETREIPRLPSLAP